MESKSLFPYVFLPFAPALSRSTAPNLSGWPLLNHRPRPKHPEAARCPCAEATGSIGLLRSVYRDPRRKRAA
jgi:hypothetical protein